MCVIGNPPYSGISKNIGGWITGLIDDYKYVNGKHFGERKHWLHDDYVKFIRMSESLIEKNGEGILGFITNHGYLDNPTFRGMRWHLLRTFEKIYVLDLHGNANKKETTPDGKPDKNVFDIQQGVSIIIAVKKRGQKKGMATVRHGELWGNRNGKYQSLEAGSTGSLITQNIDCAAPQFAFAPRNNKLSEIYGKGIGLAKFMSNNVTGIVTMGDGLALADSAGELRQNIDDVLNNDHSEETLKARYYLGKNYAKWILENKPALLKASLEPVPISYRPFDTRVTYFDNRILWRWRKQTMRHMIAGDNLGLICPKIKKEQAGGLVTTHICGHKAYDAYDSNSLFPLYLYPDEQDLDQTRRINFDRKLYKTLLKLAKHPKHGTPDEVQTFDYIYGVLHCPAYRKTYDEFLRIDFPRIPWPASPDEFWDVSTKGSALRKLHLMDPVAIGQTPYPFMTVEGNEGDNVVDKPALENRKIWINQTQYFDTPPEISWDFYIGGYQPAQKWLKDRKGRALSFSDVQHYQRILKILFETDRIMKTITMTLDTSNDA